MAYEKEAKDLASKAIDASASSKSMGAGADDDDPEMGAGDDEMDSYDAVEDSAAEDLAKFAGVKDADKSDFKQALSDYVKACVQRAIDEGK